MRIDVITLFPGMFSGPLTESILQRAQEEKLLELNFHDLRKFGIGNYRQVDDSPYGGGAGMVLKADVIVTAMERVVIEGEKGEKGKKGKKGLKPHRIYLSPRGERLTQPKVEQIAIDHEWLVLLCGHYEGIDQRVIDGGWIDEEISIGDYVLTGGELPAMVLIDAVARQIPGVLGKDESAQEESFSEALDRKKEYPHYTRPDEFQGLKVPEVLLNGNHAEIEKWRRSKIDN
ncbi:tRNA (guanosine(37)-N1)-methyltransferase TrmD [Patescibacteria group bacterium]|nr:tRNA (guanosine(37)-N1)-methyltransferase TrmD [Patescibacteria group bacterium]MBU2259228.1 tRNA (guanosine(37)-N1)-methyltransferase TrmD [Patescibacteria group bacterium]